MLKRQMNPQTQTTFIQNPCRYLGATKRFDFTPDFKLINTHTLSAFELVSN